MIPLRDSVRSRTFPIVNTVLIAANVAVFFYQLSLPSAALETFWRTWGMTPSAVWGGESGLLAGLFAEGATFFTATFLHGGWLHLIGNMWFLYIFGDNVEDSMGHGRYLAFYLLLGVGAGIAHLLFNPLSTVPTVGASGAISGVMGAYMVLYPRGRVLTLIPIFIFIQFLEIPAMLFLLIWMVIQTAQGVTSLGMPADAGGVAWWAHIGGFVLGALLVLLFRRRSRHRWLG